MSDSYFSSQMKVTMMQAMMKLLARMTEKSGSAGESSLADLFGLSTTSTNKSASTGDFQKIIAEASAKYGVDSNLVEAVIQAESNFDPSAISSAGAEGLMQLMPATAENLGVSDSLDPEQNVDGGVRLLRTLLNSYDGNVSLALAAYNAGPEAVAKYDGIPPYQETQTYVQRVLAAYKS
ncbi:MAG: lytic transglycosylase domain-containing protein [Anaerolineaceae bacterium]